MRYKIYASDEGFGHLVRQQAIHDELARLQPGLRPTLQTKLQMSAAKNLFGDIDYIEKFNNIEWAKTGSGMPDLEGIRSFFSDYQKRSDDFIERENDLDQFRFVVSDFVYEAFPVAARHNLPAFGVAHFTWDWFFSKLYPLPLSSQILRKMRIHALSADVLFFPPFTPSDILNAYRSNAKVVPLIVRQRCVKKQRDMEGDFNVLIMDSGTRLLSGRLQEVASGLGEMPDIHFFLPAYIGIQGDNITNIGSNELFLDYMPFMDLVIARAGFNTISECVAHRVPLLLVGEALNPEMDMNMLMLKQMRLASFISFDNFNGNLRDVLYDFIEHEYRSVKRTMDAHEFEADGARVVAEEILDFISLPSRLGREAVAHGRQQSSSRNLPARPMVRDRR